MRILEQVTLSNHTTFQLGGPARYFTTVTSTEELGGALSYAKEKSLPVYILGGGSNVLVSDAGFPGLIIKIDIRGIDTVAETDTYVDVRAGAGEEWDRFVSTMVGQGLGGIENLSFIPGSVGAAPIQNIGAYGAEVDNVIVSVDTIAITTGVAKTFTNKECEFGYRDSVFKKRGGYVITHVTFRLAKYPEVNISYKDLNDFFSRRGINYGNKLSGGKSPTILDVRNAVIEIRKLKLPDVSVCGTAGSFFKNPIISKASFDLLKKKYPELPSFPLSEGVVKIPLGWVLDHVCGWKGFIRGSIGIYEKQALVIINTGGGTAREVAALAEEIKISVREHTGIDIEPEVQYVGF